MPIHVLVTDGENRSSLAVTRSLAQKGFVVLVTGKQRHCLSSCSRFCRKCFSVPDPSSSGAQYAAAIREILVKERVDVIIPTSEVSIHILNRMREDLPPWAIPACVPADKMALVSNKVALFRLAEKLGVPIPDTFFLDGPEDLPFVIDGILRYPVVVKPFLSRIFEKGRFLHGGVNYAHSRNELSHLYETSPVLRYPSMIQEKIVGPGTGLFTLYDKDHHLALFSHRRLREKPPSGGVSVVSESAPLDDEMIESADRLLSAVGWEGVAMVEFKRDLRDGKAKLMEINGRFWGTLELAIACGIDFPALLLDYLQGRSFPRVIRDYPIGRKLKWFFGTLDHLLILLKNGSPNSRTLSETLPGARSRALRDFLRIREKDTSFDVFKPNDLRPFLCEAGTYLTQLITNER